MKARLQAWAIQIDSLSIRERAILLLTATLIIGYILFIGLIKPTWGQLKARQTELANLRTQLTAIEVRSRELANGEGSPEQTRRREIHQLQQQVQHQQQQIQARLGTVINPTQAAQLLQQLLNQTDNLRLVHLQTTTGPALFAGQDKALPGGTGVGRYNLSLEMEGTYAAAADYLEKVEQLPWKVFWDSLEYDVKDYPNALIKVNLYTLGQG